MVIHVKEENASSVSDSISNGESEEHPDSEVDTFSSEGSDDCSDEDDSCDDEDGGYEDEEHSEREDERYLTQEEGSELEERSEEEEETEDDRNFISNSTEYEDSHDKAAVSSDNVVIGKRARKPTNFYVDKNHLKLLLTDVPKSERAYALGYKKRN